MSSQMTPITNEKHRLRNWGTIFDDMDSIPTEYIGKSFYEAWHDDIEKFLNKPDLEKWKMAYWIERQSEKRAGKTGFIMGLVLGLIVVGIVVNLISS